MDHPDGYYVAYTPITLSCILFMFIEMIFIHCHSCHSRMRIHHNLTNILTQLDPFRASMGCAYAFKEFGIRKYMINDIY